MLVPNNTVVQKERRYLNKRYPAVIDHRSPAPAGVCNDTGNSHYEAACGSCVWGGHIPKPFEFKSWGY